MSKRIVIPGGNGFIGSTIARLAVEAGHDAVAFGRSGRPDLPAGAAWAQSVEWRAADVFTPDAWADALEGADAVVHCIATLRPSGDETFDRVNADTALRVAERAVEADVDAFVFLSVRDTPPLVASRFLAAKRRAEREIPRRFPALRWVSLRPNLVFGPGRPGSASLAALLRAARGLAGPYSTLRGRPLPVEVVAAAAVHAAVEPSVEGVLNVDQVDDLGRTSGLVDPDAISEAPLAPVLAGLGGAAAGAWLLRRWLSNR
jgi:uncharacterized protein YbjT (DUF2867 family)